MVPYIAQSVDQALFTNDPDRGEREVEVRRQTPTRLREIHGQALVPSHDSTSTNSNLLKPIISNFGPVAYLPSVHGFRLTECK